MNEQNPHESRNPFRNPTNTTITDLDRGSGRVSSAISGGAPSSEAVGASSQLFSGASQMSFQGTNSFTSAGGSIFNVNPSVSLVLQNDLAGPSSSDLPGPSGAVGMPNQFLYQPEHESEVYARILMPKRHGYPLWYPEPLSTLHPEHQLTGIRIGDVGLITADGEFDFLFNICVPSDDPINGDSVPEGFQPIRPEIQSRDIKTTPVAWKAGSHVSNGSVRTVQPRTVNDFQGRYSFEGFASEGALLTLPEGAMRVNLLSLAPFCSYAGKHARSWYHFANGPRGRMAANGSLYLVTGYDKARSWGTASFSSVLGDGTFGMSFVDATPTSRTAGRRQTNSDYPFIWNQAGCAATKEGPYLQNRNRDMEIERPQNQTVFIRGFRVALPETIWTSLMGKVEVVPMTELTANALLQKGGFIPFSGVSSGWSEYFGFGRRSDVSTSKGQSDSPSVAAASEAILKSDVPSPRVDLHPLYSINKYLLAKFPEAEAAVTHDELWCDALTKDETALPSITEILDIINWRYVAVCKDGVAAFEPKSITGDATTLPLGALTPSPLLPNSREERSSLLLLATANSDEALVRRLLVEGDLDVNTRNEFGSTPLLLVARTGNTEIVVMLLSVEGIDVNCEDHEGWTPTIAAARYGHHLILSNLFRHPKYDPNGVTCAKWSPLGLAARFGHDSVVRVLLSQATLDVNAKDDAGWTPLAFAAYAGHGQVVEELLVSNSTSYTLPTRETIEVNVTEARGYTPLALACHEGHNHIVEILSRLQKIDPNLPNLDGYTPLMIASARGHAGVVRLLLDIPSIDLYAKAKNGESAYTLLMMNHHDAVAALSLDQSRNLSSPPQGSKAQPRQIKAPARMPFPGNTSPEASMDNQLRNPDLRALKLLNQAYIESPTPSVTECQRLAGQLGIAPQEVERWFLNRRSGLKA